MMDRGPFVILSVRSGGPYGALCVVKRADDVLGREVSMKVLRNTLMQQPTFLTRARDEARMLSRVNHPNIVRVEGLMRIGKRHVIVMEALNGVTIRQVMNAYRGAPPPAIALHVTRIAARAMDHAYNGIASTGGRPLRIVHRDLRPGNLFITVHGVLKLIDFGLARADYNDRETSTVSTILGSEGYIAPERFAKVPDDASVDVYALGVTLLEMLTGELPAVGLLPDAHAYIYEQHLLLLRDRQPDLENVFDPLIALISSMCNYNRESRPSMQEVQDRIKDIESALNHPITLLDYAKEGCAPLFEALSSKPPREHPDWPEVAFLEEFVPNPVDVSMPGDNASVLANRRIRRAISKPNWPENYREIRDLLAIETDWTPEPFLPILAAAVRSWWQFWSPAPPMTHVVASLKLVRRRRTVEVVDYARALANHRDPHISTAAKKLLKVHDES
jgi:serine/threonine protein kinase